MVIVKNSSKPKTWKITQSCVNYKTSEISYPIWLRLSVSHGDSRSREFRIGWCGSSGLRGEKLHFVKAILKEIYCWLTFLGNFFQYCLQKCRQQYFRLHEEVPGKTRQCGPMFIRSPTESVRYRGYSWNALERSVKNWRLLFFKWQYGHDLLYPNSICEEHLKNPFNLFILVSPGSCASFSSVSSCSQWCLLTGACSVLLTLGLSLLLPLGWSLHCCPSTKAYTATPRLKPILLPLG